MAADQGNDAFFSFGTDIDAAANQVDAGLGRIEQSLGKAHGLDAKQFMAGLGEGVKAEVQTAVTALKELVTEQRRASILGKYSGPTFAQGADTTLDKARTNVREQVITAATQARQSGADIGNVNLGALLRELDQHVFGHLTGISRRLTQEIAQTNNIGLQATIGRVEDIRKPSNAAYRVGTVDEQLQGAIGDHAQQEKAAGTAAKKLAEASTKAADELAKPKPGSGTGGGQRGPTAATGGGSAGDGSQGGGRGRGGNAVPPAGGPDPDDEAARNPRRQADAQDLADRAKERAERSGATEEEIEASHALTRELYEAKEDIRRKARRKEEFEDTGVRQTAPGEFVDERSGTKKVALPDSLGGHSYVDEEKNPAAYLKRDTADEDQKADAQSIREKEELNARIREEKESKRAATEATRAAAAAERELAASINEQNKRGVLNNFLGGLGSSGFGGSKGFSVEGLSRSAGQTLKYSALYSGLGLLQTGASAAAEEFLNMNDSITELNIAFGDAAPATASFNNQLQDFAAQGGFNVGDAMDVAAQGVRAFGDEVKAQGETADQTRDKFQNLGSDFEKQASRIAILTKTTLPVAGQALTNITTGFGLSKDSIGFTQVTDAIAGAKKVGGGDEQQILTGLAQSAVLAKQLGFDVNQTASIISKINASTGESGQLAATRLTRVASILQGTTGRNEINNLNQQLPNAQRIDIKASIADQLNQLANVVNPPEGGKSVLSEQQKSLLVSKLGGQSGGREVEVLLQQLPGLNKKIEGQDFQGQGLKEYQDRLNNVRETLVAIQGDIRAIVTNLAGSVIAEPFVELLNVLKPITAALREATQVLNRGAEAAGKVGRAVIDIGVAVAALAAIGAVRGAGGLGGLLSNAERIVRPQAALARQQIVDNAAKKADFSAVPVTPRTEGDVKGGIEDARFKQAHATNELVDAPGNLAAKTRLVAAELDEASLELEKAALRLRKAENDLLASKAGKTGAKPEDQAQRDVDKAKKDVDQRTQDVAKKDAEHLNIKDRYSADEGVTKRFGQLRADEQEEYSKKLAKINRQLDGLANDDEAGKKKFLARQEALTDSYTARLAALNDEELIARGRAAALAGGSGPLRFGDKVTGGVIGRVAADEEKTRLGQLSAGKVIKGSLKEAGTTIKGAVSDPFVGLTLATIGIGMVQEIKDGYENIQHAEEESTKVYNKAVVQTADGLKAAAEENGTAAKILAESTSGFLGGIGDFLDNHEGSNQAKAQELYADKLKRSAAEVASIEARSIHSNDIDTLRNTLDTSSVDGVAKSFQALADAGVEPEQRVRVLAAAIDALGIAVGKVPLTEADRAKIGGIVGAKTADSVESDLNLAHEDLNVNQNWGVLRSLFRNVPAIGGGQGAIDRDKATIEALSGVNRAQVGDITDQATRDFLKTNPNGIGSKEATEGYKKLLTQQYKDAGIKEAAIPILVQDAVAAARAGGANLGRILGNADELSNLLASAPKEAADLGAHAAQDSKLATQDAGTPDVSDVKGATTTLGDLQEKYAKAKGIADQLKAAGSITQDEETKRLTPLMEDIKAARIDLYDKAAKTATNLLADSDAVRKSLDRNASGADDLEKIGQASFDTDIRTAVNSKNPEIIQKVLDKGNKQQALAFLAWLKGQQAGLKAVSDSLRDQEARLRSIGDQADADRIGAQADTYDRRAAAYDPQIGLVQKGIDRADFTDTTNRGSDAGGGSRKQLDAAEEHRKAANQRNSLLDKHANILEAQQALEDAKGPLEKAKAATALTQAKQQYIDGLLAQKRSGEDVNARDDIAIDVAARAVRDDDDELRKYTKGTQEYNEALKKKNADLRAQALAEIDAAHTLAESQGDVTDAIAEDGRALDRDRKKRAVDAKDPKLTGRNREVRLAEDQNTINADLNKREADIHSRKLKDAEDLHNLGVLSQGAYLQALQAEQDRIQVQLAATKQGTNQYQQLKDELTESKLKIKEAAKGLSGQFNLGDIKVPTVYEVRRAIKNATSSTESAVTAANVSNAIHNTTINVNGADLAAVDALLRKYVGSANRYTPATRKS